MSQRLEFSYLRDQIVGIDSPFETPFGQRIMTYCDYTASGRCLRFVEHYLMRLQRRYANTHTEDDSTGRSMTRLLQQAEEMIKDSVHAGPQGRIIAVGTGATGAISKFQDLIGTGFPPATTAVLHRLTREYLGDENYISYVEYLREHRPVAFVGPYEHHSNEVTWREGFATVVEVGLDQHGHLDLNHLQSLLADERYQGRLRIGSFSAASNVTGLITPVHEVAEMLHAHDAWACFDYAASAPYVTIDMNPGPPGQALDAIFISPHKFLGGPGASGVLVFNEQLYDRDLAPTVGGGGTVEYVGPDCHDFIAGIEEREKAGTPGVLQTIRAALAFAVKQRVGTERIEAREDQLLERAFRRWQEHPGIEILGDQDPARRVAIVSFNVRDPRGGYLHPKLVTVLLNDLFGIQSRAGCSCAGPYGHRLLGIDHETSERFRAWIKKGYQGIKPGWCRVGFHYAMDDVEADFVIDAVLFLADFGYSFIGKYAFELRSGAWAHCDQSALCDCISLDAALAPESSPGAPLPSAIRQDLYKHYLSEARELAEVSKAGVPPEPSRLEGELGELQVFSL